MSFTITQRTGCWFSFGAVRFTEKCLCLRGFCENCTLEIQLGAKSLTNDYSLLRRASLELQSRLWMVNGEWNIYSKFNHHSCSLASLEEMHLVKNLIGNCSVASAPDEIATIQCSNALQGPMPHCILLLLLRPSSNEMLSICNKLWPSIHRTYVCIRSCCNHLFSQPPTTVLYRWIFLISFADWPIYSGNWNRPGNFYCEHNQRLWFLKWLINFSWIYGHRFIRRNADWLGCVVRRDGK